MHGATIKILRKFVSVRAINAYGGVEVQFCSFLTSELR